MSEEEHGDIRATHVRAGCKSCEITTRHRTVPGCALTELIKSLSRQLSLSNDEFQRMEIHGDQSAYLDEIEFN